VGLFGDITGAIGGFARGVGEFVNEFSQTPFGGALAGIGVDFLREKALGVPQVQRIIVGGGGQPLHQFPIAAPQVRNLNPIISTPAGFTGGSQMPTVLPGGAVFADFNVPSLGDVFGGNPGINCPVLFKPNRPGARPASMVMVPNPVTGEPVLFKHAGKILLTTSDMTAHRRVNRLARKASRRRPR